MTNTSEVDGDASGECQRCGEPEQTSKVKLGANRENAHYSTFRICDDCTRSFGEWFDRGDES